MYLFFDTETTGLPNNWKAPASALNNWPRMVQIAWILSDNNGNRIENVDFIIKPENYKIPKSATKVHGITNQVAHQQGRDLETILRKFNKQVRKTDYIVAHNINFDLKIVGAELLRKELNIYFQEKRRICTMKSTTNYCKLPGKFGYKWPNLSELHIKLFGEDFEEAHDAAIDIKATEKCFWELKKIGVL
ncbi:MAG TPA: 3'-5' exonuclease [bacterium]|nr:3'-5' exonuclease [bacterium]